MTSVDYATSTRCSARCRFRRAGRPGAWAGAEGDHRSGAVAFLGPHPFFAESRASRDNPEGRLVCLGRSAPDGTPAQQLAVGLRRQRLDLGCAAQAVLPAQLPGQQPDFNYHNPAVQDWALSETLRFWLDRGVDGFRFDTVNYFFHDRKLRDNPADPSKDRARGNPYGMQYHLFDKNQPENLAWLERIRRLLDSYTARPRWARWAKPPRHRDDGRLHRAGPAAPVLQLRDAGRRLRAGLLPRAASRGFSPMRAAGLADVGLFQP
jgi:hypothetical protein